jgi:hypothetical protein
MDETAKTKFEPILKRDQEERNAISEEQTKKKNEEEAHQAKWYAHMTGTLIPGLKSIVEWLTRSGWMCQVEPDGKALVVRIYRGDMRARSGTGRPELKFDMDDKGRISTRQTLPPGAPHAGPDNDPSTVEDLTVDFVEGQIFQFVELLVIG